MILEFHCLDNTNRSKFGILSYQNSKTIHYLLIFIFICDRQVSPTTSVITCRWSGSGWWWWWPTGRDQFFFEKKRKKERENG